VVQVRLGEARATERCGEAGGLYPDWGKVGTASRGSASPRKQTSSVRTDAHGESAEHTPQGQAGRRGAACGTMSVRAVRRLTGPARTPAPQRQRPRRWPQPKE
jgi:hypothetical protein